nr:3-ketodihydrosphingosine reductase [Odocoileus virginianus texanus]
MKASEKRDGDWSGCDGSGAGAHAVPSTEARRSGPTRRQPPAAASDPGRLGARPRSPKEPPPPRRKVLVPSGRRGPSRPAAPRRAGLPPRAVSSAGSGGARPRPGRLRGPGVSVLRLPDESAEGAEGPRDTAGTPRSLATRARRAALAGVRGSAGAAPGRRLARVTAGRTVREVSLSGGAAALASGVGAILPRLHGLYLLDSAWGRPVTGGSSGIGKCIAIECYKQGAFITLVARNEDKLLQAKKEIEKHSINDKQVVLCISVDVSQDYSQVENVIKQAQEKLGPVDMLVNCAGMSLAGKFEDLEVSTFERLMSVNYLGSVYPSRAVIATMKERRVGRVVFVSSQAGQLGLFGYTAYSSSKFAIRGLAEALQMEVKPYNVYVTVAYPPDTDTPGFAKENQTKPLETRLISETTSVCKPEQVAKQIVKDAIQGNFSSSIGSDGYMLSSLTCGMAPVTSITEGLQQVVTMGLFRTIALFYLGSFDSIVRRCMMQKAKSETIDKTA